MEKQTIRNKMKGMSKIKLKEQVRKLDKMSKRNWRESDHDD